MVNTKAKHRTRAAVNQTGREKLRLLFIVTGKDSARQVG
jgi:hypothetical protein